MRRLFGWLAGLAGIAAFARILARRHARHMAPAPPPEQDPAAELRRRLSENRAEPSAPLPPEPTPDAPRESLEERRARVHAKAMDAIEEMKEPDA